MCRIDLSIFIQRLDMPTFFIAKQKNSYFSGWKKSSKIPFEQILKSKTKLHLFVESSDFLQ